MTLSRWQINMFLVISTMLGGCLGSGGTATRYYIIDPVAGAGAQGSDGNAFTVEIQDLDIPQYLERFHIATRTSGNGIHYSEFDQWGENLRKNLLRTLALNLARELGTDDVATPLNRSMSSPDIRVKVHVDRFERGADGVVRLDAHWQVSKVQSRNLSATQSVSLVGETAVADGDYLATVAVMGELFGELSGRIAQSILAHHGQM